MHNPHLGSEGLCSSSLRTWDLHELFGILQRRIFSSLSLFSHLYWYRFMNNFVLWVIIQYYFIYFVAQIFPAALLSACRLIWYISSLVLESAIFPRSPSCFYWRMVLAAQIWVVGMFIATRVISFRPSQLTGQGNICVYSNPLNTHISKYFCR